MWNITCVAPIVSWASTHRLLAEPFDSIMFAISGVLVSVQCYASDDRTTYVQLFCSGDLDLDSVGSYYFVLGFKEYSALPFLVVGTVMG